VKELEALIIDVNGLEIVNPIHGSTSFIPHSDLHCIDYPFGGSFEYNFNITLKLIECFLQIKQEHFKFRHKIQLLCRGNSGSTIATIFATELLRHGYQSKIVYIPKTDEKRHGSLNFTYSAEDVYVIVDDFVVSGLTVDSIYQAVKDLLPLNHQYIDVVCVTGSVGRRDFDFPVKYVICKEVK